MALSSLISQNCTIIVFPTNPSICSMITLYIHIKVTSCIDYAYILPGEYDAGCKARRAGFKHYGVFCRHQKCIGYFWTAAKKVWYFYHLNFYISKQVQFSDFLNNFQASIYFNLTHQRVFVCYSNIMHIVADLPQLALD